MSAPTTYSEIRVIKYPCIVAGETVDRYGFFLVDFDKAGQPIRADVLGMVGYRTVDKFLSDDTANTMDALQAGGFKIIGSALSSLQQCKVIHRNTFAAAGPEDLAEIVGAIDAAMYEKETLFCNCQPIDLDSEAWAGILYFPRVPVLR